MRTKEFIGQLDHDRIVAAIKEAEANTSGEIRVFIQRGKLASDPVKAAVSRFHRLGMHKTRERNAVLIFVAPRARKFAVVGDEAVHKRCGEAYWQYVVDLMREHFRNEQFSEAITAAVRDVGRVLAEHFPKTGDRSNELPDEVAED